MWGVPGGAALGGPGSQAQLWPQFRTGAGVAFDVKTDVTIDARGLAKVARVDFPSGCTVHGLVATCADDLRADGGPSGLVSLNSWLHVRALPGVKAGEHGGYTLKASSPLWRGPAVLAGRVEIGAPDLKPAPLVGHQGLRVGQTVAEPVSFTNRGDRPSAGVQVFLQTSPGLTFAREYRNCDYHEAKGFDFSWALCHFPGARITPGETAALTAPATVKVGAAALDTGLQVVTMPAGDPNFWTMTYDHRGTGPALGLRVVHRGRPTAVPASDMGLPGATTFNSSVALLAARNTADLQVWGSTSFFQKQGAVVPVSFGLLDRGPGGLWNTPLQLRFTAPPGTTVVTADGSCHLENPSVPGTYLCDDAALAFGPQARATWNFQLRVDQVVQNAKGRVELTRHFPFDPNPANDSSWVTVN
ncbi:hypothetical protein DN069_14700 [Streptacidiphilus pinicola]|uniref:Uncharacterized protein n=1 Tax=Streptacidiphilus pinicola TaxID=2219663 RepID=A0A2X0KD07_9ACTN|nr:hypothetical protein [Streptacidiphilus pinicola]RAG84850.1 hypothetical protein DN069_14700 [Streptacidiphilus pinicola]